MKKTVITIIISILILFSFFTGNVLYSTFFERSPEQTQMRETLTAWDMNYEMVIQYIKEHEGFNDGNKYSCPAGYQTIGYGHLIKKGEVFPYNITEQQADEILRRDFDKAIELCEIHTDLTGTKKLAIAHFIFAKGIGNFLRSTLKKCIDNNKPIDNEILKWCHYFKPDGTKIKSNYSYKIRQWELELYNK